MIVQIVKSLVEGQLSNGYGRGEMDRDRRGWKLASPPLAVLPQAPVSESCNSSRTSSGSGGAPGSPGLGKDEIQEDDPTTLSLLPTTLAPLLSRPLGDPLSRFREPEAMELDGLLSPSGW